MNKRRPNERDAASGAPTGAALGAIAPDGTIQGGNGALAGLLGLTLAELIGQALDTFLPGVVSLVIGAAMPNPSVMLWSAKPTTSTPVKAMVPT